MNMSNNVGKISEYIQKQENSSINSSIDKSTPLSSYPRRTYNQIQEAIIDCLEKLPRSTYGVAKSCKMHWRTADRHLHHLEYLGKIKSLVLVRPTKLGKKKLPPITFWMIK